MYWDGQRWTGPDVPDYVPTIPPDRATGPFIMNVEGVSRLWVRGLMTDGPFPTHYEPFESPVTNPLFPKVRGNPVSRVFGNDFEIFGDAEEFPIVATTYRLVEHFHYWTKSVHINAVLQPEFFVELSLLNQTEDALSRFEQAVLRVPEILECHLMSGQADYLLRIAARDAQDYERIHRTRIARLPGMSRIISSLALRTVKGWSGYPVG